MKLKLEPIWGYGWSNASRAFEVPAAFELDTVAALPDGSGRLLSVLGQVHEPNHPLSGFWVRLTARHVEDTGYYVLEAFAEQPELKHPRDARGPGQIHPKVTGFVRGACRATNGLATVSRELKDAWEIHEGRVRAVGDAPLIDDLLKNKLVEVRKGNWAILYRHQETGEFWDLTYPEGEMQGGGPRRLRVVTNPDDWIPYPEERPSRR